MREVGYVGLYRPYTWESVRQEGGTHCIRGKSLSVGCVAR